MGLKRGAVVGVREMEELDQVSGSIINTDTISDPSFPLSELCN